MRKAAALALAQNTGWLSVTLFGGEPLMRPSILEIVERAVHDARLAYGRPVELRWLLDTNGTLLSERVLEWLAPPKPAKVFVSLDGVPAAHDANRSDAGGNGTHAQVVEGIERLRLRQIPFEIVAVVDPNSVQHLGESLAFLLTLGADRLKFQANLRANWAPAAVDAFCHHAKDAATVWANEFRQGRRPMVEPFHSKVLSHLFGGLHRPSRCQLATREFAVAPSGRIYPCAEMVGQDNRLDLVVGEVSTGFDQARILTLRDQAQKAVESCAGCALSNRCLNSCACHQLASAGQLGQATATLCDLEAGWIDATDSLAEQLVLENCQQFVEFYYEGTWSVAASASTAGESLVQIRRKPQDVVHTGTHRSPHRST